MKKGLILFGFGLLVLSSCVKDRTCTCTSTGSGYSDTETYVYKSTKKTAEAACASNEASYGSYTTTCVLD